MRVHMCVLQNMQVYRYLGGCISIMRERLVLITKGTYTRSTLALPLALPLDPRGARVSARLATAA